MTEQTNQSEERCATCGGDGRSECDEPMCTRFEERHDECPDCRGTGKAVPPSAQEPIGEACGTCADRQRKLNELGGGVAGICPECKSTYAMIPERTLVASEPVDDHQGVRRKLGSITAPDEPHPLAGLVAEDQGTQERTCPSEDCPFCNGESCAICNGLPGCWHDVMERHDAPPLAAPPEPVGEGNCCIKDGNAHTPSGGELLWCARHSEARVGDTPPMVERYGGLVPYLRAVIADTERHIHGCAYIEVNTLSTIAETILRLSTPPAAPPVEPVPDEFRRALYELEGETPCSSEECGCCSVIWPLVKQLLGLLDTQPAAPPVEVTRERCARCESEGWADGCSWYDNTHDACDECGSCQDCPRTPAPVDQKAGQSPSTPDWQREHDQLLESVVRVCLESRKHPKEQQAAYLRDALLSMCDPLMIVTQRIAAAQKDTPNA